MAIKILLIDDNRYDQELAIRALRDLPSPPGPVEIVTAEEWAQALPHLEAGGIDLILLDYNLPGLSGLDILRRLAGTRHAPVVMMTAQQDVATAIETLRAGAHDYVVKSAETGPGLCLAVERTLDRVRLERELAESRRRLAEHAATLEQKVVTRTAVVRAQASEIETLYLKAEEAARLKAEIVANVSHELRTPLSVILGYIEILEERLAHEGNVEAHGMLSQVRSQSERLRHLVDSLLALGRLRSGCESVQRDRFSLSALVDGLAADAALLNTDHGLTVEVSAAPEGCEVVHDREKVRTIAYHLLSNAIKFTPHGQVHATFVAAPDGGLVVTVADTGIGLPLEAQAVAFEDFRQVDGSSTRRFEGLGLGLGIVQRYAALLGGRIRVDSSSGQGTTITVELPALLESMATLSRPETAGTP